MFIEVINVKHVLLDGTHNPRELRNALGCFPTGVTVITTRTPAGKLEGLTANSFSALSLDPPLILWSINSNSASVASFLESGYFAINVLRQDQQHISHHFATRQLSKFESVAHDLGVGGSPIIQNALATFECETEKTVEGGDHLLFIGRVHKLSYDEGKPLIFNFGQYCTSVPLFKGTADADLDSIWGGLG